VNQELIVLASGSPRRRELLRQINLPHQVRPADVDETRSPGEPPSDYARRIALDKAEHVARLLDGADDRIILAADTAVVLGDEVIGKPADAADAASMLRRLSGREHQVVTAVAGIRGRRRLVELSVSSVAFRPISETEISSYVASGEPMGKAGAYAIQGFAAVFAERLAGSYSGVMGLPLFETARLLAQLGVAIQPLTGSARNE
jgi:septum formation protein